MATSSGLHLNLRTGITTLVVALVIGAIAWAFASGFVDVRALTPAQRQSALEKQANSLMPPGSDTWWAEFYECATVAMHPDCASLNYGFERLKGTDASRQIQDAALANGWSIDDDHSYPDYIAFKRPGFTASVYLEDADTADPCLPDVPAASCMAYVDIQKDGIRWP